jgi:hypothetical protein
MADSASEDFLHSLPVDYPGYAEPDHSDGVIPPRRRTPTMLLTAGWLAVGLVVGVMAVTVLHSSRSSNAAGLPAAVAGNQQPQGPGGFGGGPGFGGGFDGEQHIAGTLTAVGTSTVTVRSTTGTTTYRIDATTQLIKDGQQVSSLSAMHIGDSVVVHVYPLNGSTHVERVIDNEPAGTTTT